MDMEWTMILDMYAVPLALVLGLMVGSFLNVVIARLPVMLKNQWDEDIAQYAQTHAGSGTDVCEPTPFPNPADTHPPSSAFNLLTPRSCCPQCKSPIASWFNIPVLGFLLLKGRCRDCAKPISWRYPIMELLTGLLFAGLAYQQGNLSASWPLMGLVAALMALAVIDWDTYLLPDDITLPLLWLGMAYNMITGAVSLQSSVIGAMAGYLCLWLVYQGFKITTGKEGMGFGDFKLLAALGAWFGWMSLPSILLISSMAGALGGLVMLALKGKNRNHPIPFGPALVLGGLCWLYIVPVRQLLG